YQIMNKLLHTMMAVFFLPLCLIAQTPYTFNYQGIARDASGQPLKGKDIQLKLSTMNGGDVIYSERQALTTNDFDVFTAVIGIGSDATGSLSARNFAKPLSLKVEMDPSGGTSFDDLGTTALQSVPYAMAANSLLTTNSG